MSLIAPIVFLPQTAYILPLWQETSIQPYSSNADKWFAETPLPTGFVLNSKSGLIHGYGIVPGVWNLLLIAENNYGKTSVAVSLTICEYLTAAEVIKNININLTTGMVMMQDANANLAGDVRYGDKIKFKVNFVSGSGSGTGFNSIGSGSIKYNIKSAKFSVKGSDLEPAFIIVENFYIDSLRGDYTFRCNFESDSLIAYLSDFEQEHGTYANLLCEFEFVFDRYLNESKLDKITTRPFLIRITRDFFL